MKPGMPGGGAIGSPPGGPIGRGPPNPPGMPGGMPPGIGPPTPRTGPANPSGAPPGALIGMPRPAALPDPGPGGDAHGGWWCKRGTQVGGACNNNQHNEEYDLES